MPRRTVCFLVLILAVISTPGWAEKNLKRPPGTTRYRPMVTQLQALLAYDRAQGNRRMTLSSVGRSVCGRDLWMVTLQATPPNPEGLPSSETASTPVPTPRRLLYLCRQHGHEPASTEAALQLITQLVKAAPGSSLAQELQRVTVFVVPMANPDGAEAFLRHNAHDVDLNRDWLRRTQPETQALYQAILRVRPDLMTDQHELYPSDTHPDFIETVGAGSGAPEDLVATTEDAQAVVQLAMTAAGSPTGRYLVTDHHPARLAHRYACVVAKIPTLLFETSRLTGQKRSVAARAQAHLLFMQMVLREAAGERDTLLAEAEASPSLRERALTALASRHKAYVRPGAAASPTPVAPTNADDPAAPPAKENE